MSKDKQRAQARAELDKRLRFGGRHPQTKAERDEHLDLIHDETLAVQPPADPPAQGSR